MDHFSHIYDVCRAALAGDKTLAVKSAKSLRDALAAAGDVDDAEMLSRLIKAMAGKSKTPVVHFVQSAARRGKSKG
ncbi:hypothetical protein G3A43_08065 [Paraburkholderia aspalathi]|nr:hypothetical protein [Paraburkholderia aspalathi]MBK3780211.1 hypothetical protein [Paraburkholderia aspalathi]